MARVRDWVERDHPRWPAESPDGKGGEFREKHGGGGRGDWADRVSASLPIAGGGSVATGLEAECPVCHREVKVVGNGKLSTHNRPVARNVWSVSGGRSRRATERCPGSGRAVESGDTHQEYTTRIPRQRRGTRTPDPTRPPPRPQVEMGRPKESVAASGETAAILRMSQWMTQTGRQGPLAQNPRAAHEAELQSLQKKLQGAQTDARTARRNYEFHMDRHGREGQWSYDDVLKLEGMVRTYESQIRQRQEMVDRYPAFDPANPLAYYGHMLQLEDDTWHTYAALDALEQNYPPLLHKIAAEYLASTLRGGIWIGAKPVPELDDMRRNLRGSKPGGDWKNDPRGWAAVDGVFSDGKYMIVGHTDNTESHRETRRRLYGQTQVDASAASHEFGHLLDRAIGYANNGRYREDASEQRLFRLIYGRIKREGGSALQPHFRQSGDAGPSEVWAEGLEIWGNGGTDPSPHHRGLTRREWAALQKFRIDTSTARDLMRYYDRLFAELESGKRLPVLADPGVVM